MKPRNRFIIFLISLILSPSLFADEPKAPVTGFARHFGTAEPVPFVNITILESGEKFQSYSDGHFGPIYWPVGKPITLIMEKEGFRTTQSATVVVPPEGLISPYNNISMQLLDLFVFSLFATIMDIQVDETKCHLGGTVLAYHKTMEDLPQGEEKAKIMLTPATTEKLHYFDIFTDGPFKDNPNPFPNDLNETSRDGGFVYGNLEPRNEPYVITAMKEGVGFTETKFLCRPGVFINLSPPSGPMALSSTA